ncbi:uncharacterized protein LOC131001700 [Salvia miltiorrhiza]|uniref:uncharacterized protein LOC131001700 n=1 Tax=Salvia miltiorrhiza TaxID=226208 RepID=UPI0025AD6586|nr:uncharacterized protein LOC131001700 [Salvia miltiorrhiza]
MTSAVHLPQQALPWPSPVRLASASDLAQNSHLPCFFSEISTPDYTPNRTLILSSWTTTAAVLFGVDGLDASSRRCYSQIPARQQGIAAVIPSARLNREKSMTLAELKKRGCYACTIYILFLDFVYSIDSVGA